jgi:uncharacterized membrane protein YhaH (DUF805 family)
MKIFTWCFLSTRGKLRREPFALAMAAIILVGYGLIPFTRSLFLEFRFDDEWKQDQLRRAVLGGDLLRYALMLWPLFAVQAKRVQDIGLRTTHFGVFLIIICCLLYISPWVAVSCYTIALFLLSAVPGSAIAEPHDRTTGQRPS